MTLIIKNIKSKANGKTYPCLCNGKGRIITFDPYALSGILGIRYTVLKEHLENEAIQLEVEIV